MEEGLRTSGNPNLHASGDDVRRERLNVLGGGVLHGALSGALLGAALPTLLLPIALVADELELLGPRYGSPDLDLASILVIAFVVLIGAPIGSMMGLVVGCLVGAANGLVVIWLRRGGWTSSRRASIRLVTAGLIAGAASWWISGRLISIAGNPAPLP